MTTHLVCLHGQNFLRNSDEGPRKMQFYSTRLVEAENPKLAENLARKLIQNDQRLQNGILNEESDPPFIRLKSVREVSSIGYDAQDRAHSFYWKDEDIEK
jgi:hypothetical protein